MARRKQKQVVYENVQITDIGAEGKSIAKVDDVVIFTTHVIPGDVVDLQITKKTKTVQRSQSGKNPFFFR